MSTNYVIIENALANRGVLAIAKNVFRDIAKETLLEHEYTKIADTNPFSKSIVISYIDEKLVLDIDINVKFGNKVVRVLEDIQKKIHDTIIARTSISNVEVNIGVVGFKF